MQALCVNSQLLPLPRRQAPALNAHEDRIVCGMSWIALRFLETSAVVCPVVSFKEGAAWSVDVRSCFVLTVAATVAAAKRRHTRVKVTYVSDVIM